MRTDNLPLLLKAVQVRTLLGCNHRTFRKLVRAGTIKPKRLKGIDQPRYPLGQILELVK